MLELGQALLDLMLLADPIKQQLKRPVRTGASSLERLPALLK
jgi:hypothetical protein